MNTSIRRMIDECVALEKAYEGGRLGWAAIQAILKAGLADEGKAGCKHNWNYSMSNRCTICGITSDEAWKECKPESKPVEQKIRAILQSNVRIDDCVAQIMAVTHSDPETVRISRKVAEEWRKSGVPLSADYEMWDEVGRALQEGR